MPCLWGEVHHSVLRLQPAVTNTSAGSMAHYGLGFSKPLLAASLHGSAPRPGMMTMSIATAASRTKRNLTGTHRRILAAFAVWFAFSATLFVLAERHLGGVRASALSDAGARAEQGLEALHQYLRRTLDGIAMMHGLLQAHAGIRRTDPHGANLHLEQAGRFARSGVFGSVQVAYVESDGLMSWSSIPGFVPVSLADREHIRRIQEGYRGTWFSPPVVGRTSGRWSVQATRAILDENGDLLGITVISLDPFALSRDLAELQVHDGDTAVLLRASDGVLLSAGGQLDEQFLHDRPRMNHPLVVAARARPSGRIEYRRTLDGRLAIGAFRHVPETPLLVNYSLDLEVELRPYDAIQRTIWLACLAASAFAGAALAFLVTLRVRREEREQSELLQTAKRQLDRLHTAMPTILVHGDVAADGTYTRRYLSPSAAQVTGWPLEALASADDWDRLCDPPNPLLHSRVDRERMDAGRWSTEFRLRQPDGRWIWLYYQARVIEQRDDGGGEVVGYIVDVTREKELAAQAAEATMRRKRRFRALIAPA